MFRGCSLRRALKDLNNLTSHCRSCEASGYARVLLRFLCVEGFCGVVLSFVGLNVPKRVIGQADGELYENNS
ncbi:hypothetical protein FF38_07492 [Lucilia cuprina]|uniref:Uncharacterized protein n=1 Tax=Lucilia cuprina TaxID=7375 RepID=A0A0L0CMY0_LUCCU|nr:hypothetical protein FF38_07492 [Lucilia cuprina]